MSNIEKLVSLVSNDKMFEPISQSMFDGINLQLQHDGWYKLQHSISTFRAPHWIQMTHIEVIFKPQQKEMLKEWQFFIRVSL